MKVVTDTNILFSSCITPAGKVADLLLNPNYDLTKQAAHFVVIELFKYQNKMLKISKLEEEDFYKVLYGVVKSVDFFNERRISSENMETAHQLVADIDPKDKVHVAIALELDAKLWTGDKALLNGLREKNFSQVISTSELYDLVTKK